MRRYPDLAVHRIMGDRSRGRLRRKCSAALEDLCRMRQCIPVRRSKSHVGGTQL
ncbi:MAG: hypothetical protein ACLRXC_07855 [[Clostridium] leptum]